MERTTTNVLLDRCCEDPWSLTEAERQAALTTCRAEQDCWLPILQRWVEPPGPDEGFPAFLLALPLFAELRTALQDAELQGSGAALPTCIRDELQHFADSYRCWLQGSTPDPELMSPTERDRLQTSAG